MPGINSARLQQLVEAQGGTYNPNGAHGTWDGVIKMIPFALAAAAAPYAVGALGGASAAPGAVAPAAETTAGVVTAGTSAYPTLAPIVAAESAGGGLGALAPLAAAGGGAALPQITVTGHPEAGVSMGDVAVPAVGAFSGTAMGGAPSSTPPAKTPSIPWTTILKLLTSGGAGGLAAALGGKGGGLPPRGPLPTGIAQQLQNNAWQRASTNLNRSFYQSPQAFQLISELLKRQVAQNGTPPARWDGSGPKQIGVPGPDATGTTTMGAVGGFGNGGGKMGLQPSRWVRAI